MRCCLVQIRLRKNFSQPPQNGVDDCSVWMPRVMELVCTAVYSKGGMTSLFGNMLVSSLPGKWPLVLPRIHQQAA